jgi:large subunit ribosomal protein L18
MKPVKRKRLLRQRRAMRVRKKLYGTPDRPRLCVFRSLKHLYAQAIDDTSGRTLLGLSTRAKDIRSQIGSGGNIKAAVLVGERFGQLAISKGIHGMVFDRRGYKFHGRIKAFAEAVKKAGVRF